VRLAEEKGPQFRSFYRLRFFAIIVLLLKFREFG
jgi:hypothetical protein